MIPRHLIIAIIVMLMVASGIGFYVMRMPRRAADATPAAIDNGPVAPPASGPTERVTLYVADDLTGSLRAQAANIPLPAGRQERAGELLRSLLAIYVGKSSPHAVATGSEVREVYLVDPGLAVVDVNAAFALHRSGVLVEELTVVSMIETLSANISGIARVKILVDGAERDSLAGHVDLTNFFDVAAVSQLAAQLQNTP